QRLAGFRRKIELRVEGAQLRIARREVPEKVQAAFTHGHDPVIREQLAQRRVARIIEVRRMVRVGSGRAEECLAIRHVQRRTARGNIRAGDDETRDARGPRTVEQGSAIAVEAVVGEIDADVDQVHAGSRCLPSRGKFAQDTRIDLWHKRPPRAARATEQAMTDEIRTDELKENIKAQDTWLRLLFIIIYGAILWLSAIVLAFVVVFQFLSVLFTRETQ